MIVAEQKLVGRRRCEAGGVVGVMVRFGEELLLLMILNGLRVSAVLVVVLVQIQ